MIGASTAVLTSCRVQAATSAVSPVALSVNQAALASDGQIHREVGGPTPA